MFYSMLSNFYNVFSFIFLFAEKDVKTRVKKTSNQPVTPLVDLASEEEDESDFELPVLNLEEMISLINAREIKGEKENDGDCEYGKDRGGEEKNVGEDGDDKRFEEEYVGVYFSQDSQRQVEDECMGLYYSQDAQRLTKSWYTSQPSVNGEVGYATTSTTTNTCDGIATTPGATLFPTCGSNGAVGDDTCIITSTYSVFDNETDILMGGLYEDPDDFLFVG